jgi:hypothetical protein
MRKFALFAITASLLGLDITAAHAQRVFVAAQGSDANPCTFAAPCRTFQRAHNVVAAGGEIDVLDPAGYGAVIITKAVSIQGHGFSGVSVASGGTAITINAGATDMINLSGLIIEGAGVGQNGILVNSAKAVTLENCVIRNLTNNGIQFIPTVGSSSSLTVSDTYIASNGDNGIVIQPSSGAFANANITRVEAVYNGGHGLAFVNFGAGLNVAVADSVASSNTVGVLVSAPNIFSARVMAFRSIIANNTTGVQAEGTSAQVLIGQSMISGNTSGWITVNGGTVASYGDNKIDLNDGDETAPPQTANK